MFKALEINTKEIIAIGNNRAALFAEAASKVGREGFCIRPVVEEPQGEFCSVDSGEHRTRLQSGRVI